MDVEDLDDTPSGDDGDLVVRLDAIRWTARPTAQVRHTLRRRRRRGQEDEQDEQETSTGSPWHEKLLDRRHTKSTEAGNRLRVFQSVVPTPIRNAPIDTGRIRPTTSVESTTSAMPHPTHTLVRFNRDLRVEDHRPLVEAAEGGVPSGLRLRTDR